MNLKPCPFCGGEAALEGAGPGESYWVSCESEHCSGIGDVYGTADAASAAWNRRTPVPEARDIYRSRYVWLRDNAIVSGDWIDCTNEEFDAKVDEAIAEALKGRDMNKDST